MEASRPGSDGGEGELIGYVLDNATHSSVRFVSSNPPPVGDYVVIEDGGSRLLAMVRSVGSRSITLSTLSGVYDPVVVERLSRSSGGSDVFFECTATVLGDVDELRMPRRPPLPGARVYRAPSRLLSTVFGGGRGWVRIGVLLARPEVPVHVNVNRLVTRHAAVLAVTGAGKSNTVAVLADSLARLGGTVLIFDFHGEYVGTSIGGGVNRIEAKINPRLLSVAELMVLLGVEHRFYNQEYVLRQSLRRLSSKPLQGGFFDELVKELERVRSSAARREEATAATALLNKVESLLDHYGDIIDDSAPDPALRLMPGRVNALDLGRVDEDAADVVVSHVLRVLLAERKRHRLTGRSRIPYPVLVVLEEAHILAPRDEDTLSKYWLARVAREGRKFGVGLVLVSQRPKGLDPDILGQANNLVVLRIVEPSDQRHVQEASESLTSDLVEQLSSLNTGEAVLTGPFVRVPALVRIDRFPGRLGGSDIDVVGEWEAYQAGLSAAEDSSSFYEDLL